MLVFLEGGKPENPGKTLRARRESTRNSTQPESNPSHIRGRRASSSLRQPCITAPVSCAVLYKMRPGYALVYLQEAGGLRLRLFQSFISTAIVISPASKPEIMKGTVFDEGKGLLSKWVVCALVGAL